MINKKEKTTTINVSQKIWRLLLNKRKNPKETFNDILKRLLKKEESLNEKEKK